MSTRAVSTTTRTAKVTFTAVVSDGGSGVGTVDVLANLNGSYRGYAHLTRSRGAYVGTLTVPMWQGAGTRTWMLSLVAQDRMDNRTALSPVALNRRHLPFSLRVTSRGDSSRPTLRSFSFSPASTDARSGATRVGFTLRATDTLSGLVAPTVEFTAPTRNVRSQLPAVITRVTGTPTDRTFTGYVVVGQCGQSGAWSASVGLRDRVGNSTGYGSTALRARGFPAALSVQQLDSLAPYAHTPATVAPGSPLVLTFTEPVLFAGPAASTLDVRVGGVLAAGSWVCRTSTSVTVACDADGAGVLTATFTPTTPFVLGQSLHLETVATYPTPSGIYDLAGNPFTSAFDAFVTVA
jgi:hypothetical protein